MLWDPKKDYSDTRLAMLAAADYIQKHGLCQGQMRDNWGRVCIEGAFQATIGKHYWADETFCALIRPSLPFLEGLRFTTWNDEKGRTKKQVVNKLREISEHL